MFLMRIFVLAILFFSIENQLIAQSPEYFNIEGTQKRDGMDPYLTQLYWKLNQTPMQDKLRALKPFPVGVVYYQQRGDNLDSARKQFKIIHDLGFNALKQVQLKAPNNPKDFEKQVFNAALDEGISPWYYGMAGWENITQNLLNKLNITIPLSSENMQEIQRQQTMIDYQTQFMRERIAKLDKKPSGFKGLGEPGRNYPYISERLLPYFAKWLEKQYGNIDKLREAWNDGYVEKLEVKSFEEAAILMKANGEDEYGNSKGNLSQDFRRFRDAMRFQADLVIDGYNEAMKEFQKWDKDEPERTGGHQIFENQALNSWDMEAQAKAAAVGGSFYCSIHLAHHFFLTKDEIFLPVYMQSRHVADMFKGGWAAIWESTGGPTQWSGHNGYTVNEKTIRQLMLTYLATGQKGIGFWMWNSRGEGWEAGEYALTNLQGDVSPRAIEAGKISKIIQNQRFELWEALDEPLVGVFYSWENEAILGRLSMGAYPLNTPVYETNRDKMFRQYHQQARIGISRALINENIPFEYITERDLESGLAGRYPIIYLPYVYALDEKMLPLLRKYVEEGGRLVADVPLLGMDNYGRLNKYKKGDAFEKLFGFQITDYYFTTNSPQSIYDMPVSGQFADIKITTADNLGTLSKGSPLLLQNRVGKGTTLVINCEASKMVFKPGNVVMEKWLIMQTVGRLRPEFEVIGEKNCKVFRRASPKADHYFIINDGENETITLQSESLRYKSATDLLDNNSVNVNGGKVVVKVPAGSGTWIRCEK